MATYTFADVLANPSLVSSFTVGTDYLVIPGQYTAAQLSVIPGSSSTSITIAGVGTVTLPVAAAALTPASVVFANGSKLVIGDATNSTSFDAIGADYDTTGTTALLTLTNVGDLVFGLGGNDTLGGTASDGADLFYGNEGNDVIANAGAGNYGADTAFGGQGDDSFNYAGNTAAVLMYGNLGNDTLSGGTADDILYGGQGNDQINATGGADSLYGNLGNDTINGSTASNYIEGGEGNDVIAGGAAAGAIDTVHGGDGTDTITIGLGAGLIYGNQSSDTITGGAENDTVYGGQDNDSLVGSAGADVLYGNLGADTIDLNAAGADTVYGGQDNDLIRITGDVTGLKVLNGNLGADTIDANGITTNTNDISIDGGDGADSLRGGAGADTISGGAGADTIIGGGDGGAADGDVLQGGAGDDVFSVLAAGHANADTIIGGEGTDVLRLDGAFAHLLGGAIVEVEGVTVVAAADTASAVVNLGTAFTGGVQVTVSGSSAQDTQIVGTANGDTIAGANSDDTINGAAGADSISGGDGVDAITGGAGADTLTGGASADTFVFADGNSTAATMDVITDYATGVDIIDNGGTITLAANADAAGEATITATGLVTGYNGAATAYDTLSEKLGQIDLALGGTAEQAALFTHDSKVYLYISVGTDTANDGTDTVVELTGVTATTGITLAAGDITAIA